MKKIICLLLALMMLVSVVACGTPDDSVDTDDYGTVAPDSTESITGKIDAEPYDGVFKTGFSRVVITPDVPIDGFTRVADDMTATCVAINDGENTVLLISVDMGSIMQDKCEAIRTRIKAATNIKESNIIVAATHDHSAVGFGTDAKWTLSAYTKIADAAKEAIADLADTEIYIGTGKTTGMAFVRRYINSDGTMSSVNPKSNSIASVSEADDTVQVIRFIRKDKKDIIMANWQAHLAHAINMMPTSISADMAHYLRQDVEAGDDDALFVFFAGASGNINLNPPNNSFRKYNNYIEVGQALAKVILDVAKPNTMTKVEAGKIRVMNENYVADTKKDSADFVAAAEKRIADGTATNVESYIVDRNKRDTMKMYLASLSFGDLGFIAAPYEMFDNNGVQIKEGSPFKMTFILTNAGGALAYMPSYEACTEYGGYETEATYFGAGTAEKLVDEYLKLLRKQKGLE